MTGVRASRVKSAARCFRVVSMKHRCLSACVIVALFVVQRCHAQEQTGLSIEDNLDIRHFAEYTPIAVSPDGQLVAYTVRANGRNDGVATGNYARTGTEWFAVAGDVYVVDVATKRSQNLTGGRGNNSLPVWSSDGRFLAFQSDRDPDGQERLWLWDRAANRLRKVSDVILRCEQIAWTPESNELIVTTLPAKYSPSEYARLISADSESGLDHPVASIAVFRSNLASRADEVEKLNSDPWDLNRYLRGLSLIDRESGRERPIVVGERISRFSLSPDGAEIAYTKPLRFERAGSQQILYDLVSVEVESRKQRTLAPGIKLDYDGSGFSWAPNGKRLSFLTGGPGASSSDCFIAEFAQAAPNLRSVQQGIEAPAHHQPPLWDKIGNLFYLHQGAIWRVPAGRGTSVEFSRIEGWRIRQVFADARGRLWDEKDGPHAAVVIAQETNTKEEGIFSIDLENGRYVALLKGKLCLTCANSYLLGGIGSGGKTLAFLREDAAHPSDLWTLEVASKSSTQLTEVNPQFAKYHMGQTQLIKWLSTDGQSLEGVVLLPANYEEGKRYPLVVFVYAGSAPSRYANRFGVIADGPLNMQVLATRGYAVLYPDSPQNVGSPMVDLLKTVLPGVNKVVEMGIADNDRAAVMGFSNGGFSTMALIVQTTRFKAAVEISGMADLVAAYGEMNRSGSAFATALFEHGQDAVGGTPWEVREKYIENSPIHYLDRIATPLLLIHGDGDMYVAPFLGDEIFVGLRRLGKEAEYAKYAGEGHDVVTWRRANQADACRRIIRWFDDHLRMQRKEDLPREKTGAH